MAVSGLVTPGFEPVAEAFRQNFESRGELGAGVAIYFRGEIVVDLVGGSASTDTGSPFTHDTLVNVYSAGKAIVGLLLLQLIDSGAIGLDEPIVSCWPEFGVEGKTAATIRMALCHRAGVPAIDRLLANDDLSNWSTMTEALSQTRPWHMPGERHIYHTNTYGHLIGEIVRRVTGRETSALLHEVMDDIGADVRLGLSLAEQRRCAEISLVTPIDPTTFDLGERNHDSSLQLRSYFNPPGYSSMGIVNTALWRSSVVPSTNMHATANGLATFYNALLEPDRLITTPLLIEATSPQSEGHCPILDEEATFGLGFIPTTTRRPLGPNTRSFGHFGTGGALGFCDPDAQIAFGYVMNQVTPRWQSSRNASLRASLYEALANFGHHHHF